MATLKLNPHFLEFLRCFAVHKVRYLLIGEYAVGFHGWPRNTKDIGFWIAGDGGNQARVIAAIGELAFPRLLRAKNGGALLNRINSLAASNPIYANSLRVGAQILRNVGFAGF